MHSNASIVDIIGGRYSNRTYQKKPITRSHRETINTYCATSVQGPFGGRARFQLLAATEETSASLQKLGTYGVIKNAVGFIAGAISKSNYHLEDYGYLLERIVLDATRIGLATCWLGGTFNKSGFARSISIRDDETVPAVIAVGYAADQPSLVDSIMRFAAGAKRRKPWEELFFRADFRTPLTEQAAGTYRIPLEMVRRAPSASNKQPWRIVKDERGDTFHLFLERTKNYNRRLKVIGMEDLQRIDMGIAMYHLESTAAELNLRGAWGVADPKPGIFAAEREYVSTWRGV